MIEGLWTSVAGGKVLTHKLKGGELGANPNPAVLMPVRNVYFIQNKDLFTSDHW